ncbi:MAG: hypothetical protein GWN86_22820 [Desulfobacterales bacterium]|nr:hypothetical protein [Desulfobacterales bacterium]
MVTTAPINPDQPATEDFCVDCEACIAACPVDALSQPGKTLQGGG